MSHRLTWHDLEIIRDLGRGQAGDVKLAQLRRDVRDLPKGLSVAVKCYRTWVLEQPGALERIQNELAVGRRVRHPHLVETYGLVTTPGNSPALVMKYYDGVTLDDWLEHEARLDVALSLRFLTQLAGALLALHDECVYHRDIKPANIVINEDGAVLMDLGVVSGGSSANETTAGAFLGTIRYAAPEYLLNQGAFAATADVYSLGAVGYELLTGETFYGQTDQWARLVIAKTSRLAEGHPYVQVWNARSRAEGQDVTGLSTLTGLVNAMISRDPDARPDLSTAVERLRHATDGRQLRFGAFRDDLVGATLCETVKSWRASVDCGQWACFCDISKAYLHGGDPVPVTCDASVTQLEALNMIRAQRHGQITYCVPHPKAGEAYRTGLLRLQMGAHPKELPEQIDELPEQLDASDECILDENGQCINPNPKHWGANE